MTLNHFALLDLSTSLQAADAGEINRPGMSEDLLACDLSGALGPMPSVVGRFELGWWDVAAVLVKAAVG